MESIERVLREAVAEVSQFIVEAKSDGLIQQALREPRMTALLPALRAKYGRDFVDIFALHTAIESDPSDGKSRWSRGAIDISPAILECLAEAAPSGSVRLTWDRSFGLPKSGFFFDAAMKGKLILPSSLAPFVQAEALHLVIPHIGSIMLSEGCSIGCPWCGVNPVRRVGKMMTAEEIVNLIFAGANHWPLIPSLYWGSDPLEWKGTVAWSGRAITYRTLHFIFDFITGMPPELRSAVPRGMELEALEFVDELIAEGRAQVAISVSDHNRRRLESKWPEERVRRLKEGGWWYEVPVNTALNTRTRTMSPNPLLQNFVIGCFDGIVITPEEVFNVVQVGQPNETFIEGQARAAIRAEWLTEDLPVSLRQFDALRKRLNARTALEALLQIGVVRFMPQIGDDDRGEMEIAGNRFVLENHTGAFEYLVTARGTVVTATVPRPKK